MSGFAGRSQQQGMALVVSLLFLLILTVISVVAATNSRSALKMSMNAQDGLQSFQAAEAGVYAALATSGTANDLFMGASTEDVFAAYGDDDNPLRLLDICATSDGAAALIVASKSFAEKHLGSVAGVPSV